MSLPGLQSSAPVADVHEEPTRKVHELEKSSEWRFEVAFENTVQVTLLSGTAEIFGTELAPNRQYVFTGVKAAIYTWHGCRLEISGDCQVEYTAEDTPMVSYANTHFALENLRQEAVSEGRHGPRVMIVGPDNAGKTSLAKLLAAYALKIGHRPLVINVDPREGALSMPGTLTVTEMTSILDVEEGWGSSPMSAPSSVPSKLPLAYFYGLDSPEKNDDFFKSIANALALAVTSKLEDSREVKAAGCIIDTPGIISQGAAGYDLIEHIALEFSVNVLLVLGSERLYSEMARRFASSRISTDEGINVLKLVKSGGCVDRDESYLKQLRRAQVQRYFFGGVNLTLSPHTQNIEFNQVVIYRIHEDNAQATSLMPGASADDQRETPIFVKSEPSLLLQGCVLAIMNADQNEPVEAVRDAAVLGFVYVVEVEDKKRRMKVLGPVMGRLPAKPLLWGSWPEPIAYLTH